MWLRCILFSMLLLILGLNQPSRPATPTIDANQFQSFWIWGEIKSALYLSKAKELYILQGEIRYSKQKQTSILIPQGIGTLKLPNQKIWLVFRTHHLDWSSQNYQTILTRLNHWKNLGNQIEGIQIDFDSKTRNLNEYAYFLSQFRSQLPAQYKLSITGLLDWTNFKEQDTLKLLRQNIDELVIQTYQGTTSIPNYPEYLKRIANLKLPYKIGFVQYGKLYSDLKTVHDPHFKGYVIFLLREKP